ncbi:hypothetical protein ACIP4Q_39325 [Streptomyces massasporeus]
MSTLRRLLGTGPRDTRTTTTPSARARLLPVEQLDVDEHQEHVDPRARQEDGSVLRRRPLGDRGQ